MKYTSLICFSTLALYSCMPEEDLPIRDVGKIPEYFIECYCRPGKEFALSATTVLPISGSLKIDFSKEMSVHIAADRQIDLYPMIHTLPGSDFIYNYGSQEIFYPGSADTLYLNIMPPNSVPISARTPIPAAVHIYSYSLSGQEASVSFHTSVNPGNNYYILSVEFVYQDSIVAKEVCYLDYSQYAREVVVEKRLPVSLPPSYESVKFNLKRITQENYNYQISLHAANTANQSSITTPVPLKGNIQGALGIFTCYTEDLKIIEIE